VISGNTPTLSTLCAFCRTEVTLDLREGRPTLRVALGIVTPVDRLRTVSAGASREMEHLEREFGHYQRDVGRNIRQIETALLRSKIALVTQDPFLFSGSIRDNIAPGRADMSEAQMNAILAASNCRQLIDKLPRGVDTVLSEGGVSISSGERQLISIARAFAHNPDLIIFDEATSYVDSETEQKIQGALFNLMKNRTSIIVAHRLLITRSADRILVVNRGRIVESGTHPELIQQKGFYYKLSQLQS